MHRFVKSQKKIIFSQSTIADQSKRANFNAYLANHRRPWKSIDKEDLPIEKPKFAFKPSFSHYDQTVRNKKRTKGAIEQVTKKSKVSKADTPFLKNL